MDDHVANVCRPKCKLPPDVDRRVLVHSAASASESHGALLVLEWELPHGGVWREVRRRVGGEEEASAWSRPFGGPSQKLFGGALRMLAQCLSGAFIGPFGGLFWRSPVARGAGRTRLSTCESRHSSVWYSLSCFCYVFFFFIFLCLSECWCVCLACLFVPVCVCVRGRVSVVSASLCLCLFMVV